MSNIENDIINKKKIVHFVHEIGPYKCLGSYFSSFDQIKDQIYFCKKK